MFVVRDQLTTENILNRIDQYVIFKTYCPRFEEIGKFFLSEFREETKGSAVIYFSNDRLWYKDFGSDNKAVDCFGYIMLKYNVNFYQALKIINLDFNLGLSSDTAKITPSLNLIGLPDIPEYQVQKLDTIIKPIYRKWFLRDKQYWLNNYGIDNKILKLFGVVPVTGLYLTSIYKTFTKEVFLKKDNNSYSYLIDKEFGIERFKIYSPYAESPNKWISNCKSNHYQGFNQLPLTKDLLVITKSLKDVMVLYTFDISAIAPQSEQQDIDIVFFEKLNRRFNKIVLFYDNDSAGIAGANKLKMKFNLSDIIINNDKGILENTPCIKDISDYRKEFGAEATYDLLKSFKLV
jgi:hypothetical protein